MKIFHLKKEKMCQDAFSKLKSFYKKNNFNLEYSNSNKHAQTKGSENNLKYNDESMIVSYRLIENLKNSLDKVNI